MDWTQNVEVIQWGARGWASPTGQGGFDAVFEGRIANKQIYDDELSAAEIISLAGGSGPTNSAPIARDDSFTTSEDVLVSGNVLAANGGLADSDPDGGPQPLSVTPATINTANGGTVSLLGNGDFTYTPGFGFTGPDSFTYILSDGEDTDVGTVTLTVNKEE